MSWFLKPADTQTPLLVKIGAVLSAWAYVSGVAGHISAHGQELALQRPFLWTVGLVTNAIGFVLVVAAWNLKRWGLIGLALLGALTIIPFVVSSANIWVLVGIRFVPLVLVASQWRSLTWR